MQTGPPFDHHLAFRALSDEQKASCYLALARKALDHWKLGGVTLNLIKQRENAVFAVQRWDGSRYALRVHRAGYHSDDALRSELEWMRALGDWGVQTPQVIPTADGALFAHAQVPQVPGPRQVDLFAWVSGQPIGSIEDGVRDVALAEDQYRKVGTLLAKMHNFAERWQPPTFFIRHAWDESGLLGAQPFWGRFWELEALGAGQRQLLAAARSKAQSDLVTYGTGPDRYGLIHADPLLENFLVEDDGSVRVIDFDDGGYGWFLFDFATALFMHLGEAHYPLLLAAIIQGYELERARPPEFDRKLPLFLLLRGMTYLGWAHTRSDTDTARQMTSFLVERVMALVDSYLSGKHPQTRTT